MKSCSCSKVSNTRYFIFNIFDLNIIIGLFLSMSYNVCIRHGRFSSVTLWRIYMSWSLFRKFGGKMKTSSYGDQVVFSRNTFAIDMTLLLSYIAKISVLFLTIINCSMVQHKKGAGQSPGFCSQFLDQLSLRICFKYQTTQHFWIFCFFLVFFGCFLVLKFLKKVDDLEVAQTSDLL